MQETMMASEPKATKANPTAREQEAEDKVRGAQQAVLEAEAAELGISVDALQTIRRKAEVAAEAKIRAELEAKKDGNDQDRQARDESAALNEARQLRAKKALGPAKGAKLPDGACTAVVLKTFHISPDDIIGWSEGGASIEVEPGDTICIARDKAESFERRRQIRIV
jgi:hypothetical protein